jgi:hypothetical protein
MLALSIPRKEGMMSEQLQLFPPERPVWINRLWQRIDPNRRQAIVAILAQMARDALAVPATRRTREERDES